MALISRWQLENNANDSTGAYNLTATSVTFLPRAMSGSYYAQFNGNGSKIEGTSPNILSYTNFSISAWQNLWAGTGGDIIDFGDGFSAYWQLFTYTTSGSYYLYPGKFSGISTTEKVLLQDYYYKWVHITIVDSNGTIQVYINSKLRGTVTVARQPGSTVSVVSIGANTVGTGKYYGNGMLDDVRLYNHALTEEEVKAIYNSYFSERSAQFLSNMF